uniref:Wsv293a-like protein n=1 Tax=Metapenaeus joyneri majanivirus TaxID=2984280 RepID=A0A9C7EYQ9_9VIRU|nr:MAG: wsv293a-like protein [Metapenaeus joyneri majanivirus]
MANIFNKDNIVVNDSTIPSTYNKKNEKNTILTDFNDNVKFFLGPMYKDVIYIMEEDKLNAVNDKIFMIMLLTIIVFCSSVVIYRLILYYKIIAKTITSNKDNPLSLSLLTENIK